MSMTVASSSVLSFGKPILTGGFLNCKFVERYCYLGHVALATAGDRAKKRREVENPVNFSAVSCVLGS